MLSGSGRSQIKLPPVRVESTNQFLYGTCNRINLIDPAGALAIAYALDQLDAIGQYHAAIPG
jgi:hypothetical protein